MGWGDELMVTGQVRVMQETDPRRVRVQYERQRWHESWNHNPRIAGFDEQGDFQILRPRDDWRRPYTESKGPTQWRWKAWSPPRGELYLTNEERAFGERYAGRVIVEPNIKPGASPNKQWGWTRWNKLVWLLGHENIRVTQLGTGGIPELEGVEFIDTGSMRLAAAVIAQAKACVLPEGGLHHVAAVFRTPAVVIFGGYIAPSVTGYDDQVNLFAGGEEHPLGCGMRVPCKHCEAAMASISPETVAKHLMELI
jgi:ADP-heptose:LPS heptosyltransferase